jgi:hypothetical protein
VTHHSTFEGNVSSTILALTASVVQERDGNAALEALLIEQLDQIIAIAAVEHLTGITAKLKRAAIAAS